MFAWRAAVRFNLIELHRIFVAIFSRFRPPLAPPPGFRQGSRHALAPGKSRHDWAAPI
jgi:hypothetical protein